MSAQTLEVSTRSRNGAPSRKGCVVNDQMTRQVTNEYLPPPPHDRVCLRKGYCCCLLLIIFINPSFFAPALIYPRPTSPLPARRRSLPPVIGDLVRRPCGPSAVERVSPEPRRLLSPQSPGWHPPKTACKPHREWRWRQRRRRWYRW